MVVRFQMGVVVVVGPDKEVVEGQDVVEVGPGVVVVVHDVVVEQQ